MDTTTIQVGFGITKFTIADVLVLTLSPEGDVRFVYNGLEFELHLSYQCYYCLPHDLFEVKVTRCRQSRDHPSHADVGAWDAAVIVEAFRSALCHLRSKHELTGERRFAKMHNDVVDALLCINRVRGVDLKDAGEMDAVSRVLLEFVGVCEAKLNLKRCSAPILKVDCRGMTKEAYDRERGDEMSAADSRENETDYFGFGTLQHPFTSPRADPMCLILMADGELP